MTTPPAVRPVRLTLAGLVLASSLALMPIGAAAGTTAVRMDDTFDFSPSTMVLDRGTVVRWSNRSEFTPHDVKSDLDGYFQSPGGSGGMSPGESFRRTFRSAGTFGYVCRIHRDYGMRGSVTVPIAVARLSGPTRFRITLASTSAGTGYRHVLQVRRPGATGFATIARTRSEAVTWSPSRRGSYTFRAALQHLASGELAGWSPTVTRTW